MASVADVANAVESGVSFPCAMCNKHWRGVAAGNDSCGELECGGPMSGRAFPLYDGMLPDGDWSHFCFVTGRPNDLVGVKVIGASRMLAVSREHQKIFGQCSPADGAIDCTTDRRVLLIDDKVGNVQREADR